MLPLVSASSGSATNRSIFSTISNPAPTAAMMLALLLLALATFGYLGYVLLKPEKF
ncbi:MAG: potassium-transporting ATPase subunit F [Hymenobacter sp.]